MNKLKYLAGISVLFPSLALAHSNNDGSFNFFNGLTHTLTGLDHLAVMVGVGMFAAIMGGKCVFRIPLAFVFFMLLGALMGVMDFSFSFVELVIAFSVIVMGVILLTGQNMPSKIAIPLIGAFAVFHGMAHGNEVPAGNLVGFFTGFTFSTMMLHLLGVGVFKLLDAHSSLDSKITKIVGAVIATFGISLVL